MYEDCYSTKEALYITGETWARIDYWIRIGAFQPFGKGKGMGSTRRYSFKNLLEIMLAQKLSDALQKSSFILIVLKEIRDRYPTFFEKEPEDEGIPGQCLLSVALRSQNEISAHIYNGHEAAEFRDKHLSQGFLLVNFDLNLLKANLIRKLE